MFRIDVPTAAVALPAPAVAGAEGYFSAGNPGTGTPATIVSADWLNMMQEEMRNLAALNPAFVDSKVTYNQAALGVTYLVGARRTKLVANTTLYVAIDGNDVSGDGSFATPWRTGQHAWEQLASNYDLNGFTVTVLRKDSLAYNDITLCSGKLPGQVSPVVFSASASANVTVTCAGSQNYLADLGAMITVQNQKMVNSVGGLIYATRTSLITHAGCNFGLCVGNQIAADRAATIQQTGTVTISGSASGHASASAGASIDINSATLTGTPAFGAAFVSASQCGILNSTGAVFTGAATGPRFAASQNGVIFVSGGGASYFPGNSSGTTASGGQYN